jgi:hypothetical protein
MIKVVGLLNSSFFGMKMTYRAGRLYPFVIRASPVRHNSVLLNSIRNSGPRNKKQNLKRSFYDYSKDRTHSSNNCKGPAFFRISPEIPLVSVIDSLVVLTIASQTIVVISPFLKKWHWINEKRSIKWLRCRMTKLWLWRSIKNTSKISE